MSSDAIIRNLDFDYKMRALRHRVEEFESGAIYQKLETGMSRIRRYYERRLRAKETEIEKLHRNLTSNQTMWFQVFEDVQKEALKTISQKEKQITSMKERIWELERQNNDLRDKFIAKSREVVEERRKVIDEKSKNERLRDELKQDFKNSSVPSSRTSFRGKVTNNREKTGRTPGGQTGHEGHGRKKHAVNGERIFVDAPASIKENPDYYEQGGANGEVHKQCIRMRVSVFVDDYYAKVYRNRKNGARYHAPFPANLQNDVNYDESVKTLIFLMKNHLNVSEEKIQGFFSMITDGKIAPSRGMINRINGELAVRTLQEQKEMFMRLMSSDVLYTDMTGARMNGSLKNVVICTNHDDTMYFFRDNKGDAGFSGTPAEFFDGIHVHDHDKTTYHYGKQHQECNEHHLRYLKGAMEMEKELTWHGQMRKLLQEMNTTREAQNRILTDKQIQDFEDRYDKLLDLADREYYDNPPSPYYRKGYNLSKELRDYRESVLLFLRHPEVDFTNNVSERAARKIGRHMAVSGTFRGNSNRSAEEYCKAMSILQKMRSEEGNVYQIIMEYFRREKPQKRENPKTENEKPQSDSSKE